MSTSETPKPLPTEDVRHERRAQNNQPTPTSLLTPAEPCTFKETRAKLREAIWAPVRSSIRPTLYHYTNAEGLAGIIRDRSLWLTHASFLNDETEFKEATRFLNEQITRAQTTAHGFGSAFLNALRAAINPPEPAQRPVIGHAFVGCFSKDGDSLSQWRAYGRGEGGFAIGFNADSIWSMKHQDERKPGYWLLPCVYPEERARLLCEIALAEGISEAEPRSGQVPIEDLVQGFLLAITWYSGAIKHAAFSSEEEWRLIYYRLTSEQEAEPVEFLRNSTFTPYVRFSFGDKTDMHRALDEVVIGPQRHMDLARFGVAAFLSEELGQEVIVRKSAVPFRNLS